MYQDGVQNRSPNKETIFFAWAKNGDKRNIIPDKPSVHRSVQDIEKGDVNASIEDQIKITYRWTTLFNYSILIIMTLIATGIVLNRGSVCVAK